MDSTSAGGIRLISGVCFALVMHGPGARAELAAHWKFEADALFDDTISRLHLNAESSARDDKRVFKSEARVPPRAIDSESCLRSPNAQGIDLRLRVNAPTRGDNPFRLSGNSWTLSGWLSHSGEKIEDPFGHVIAGTHGFSPVEGKGFAGWSLRVQEPKANAKVLSAVFSTGGVRPKAFELFARDALKVGSHRWTHFALVWKHDGGRSGRGEATLFVDGRQAGVAEAPRDFDAAEADRGAFRGIWIAGRPTSEEGGGANNWAGWLDEIKLMTGTVADDKLLLAEFAPEKPKEEPKPRPAVTPAPVPTPEPAPEDKKVAMKDGPPAPEPPPAPKKPEPPKEKVFELRSWKDARGLALEAAMILDPAQKRLGRVTLLTQDKIRFTVPLERLSAPDQEYVKAKGG